MWRVSGWPGLGAASEIYLFGTLEDKARMFASLSEPAEVAYLADVIHSRAQPAARVAAGLSLSPALATDPLGRQWLDGDLARLGPALVRDMGRANPGLYDAL